MFSLEAARKLRSRSRTAAGDDRWQARALVVAAIVLTAVLSVTINSYGLLLYNTFLLADIGASALNLSMGTAGLISVASAAFLCVGSITGVVAGAAGLPFPLAVVAAAIVSAVIGALFVLPAARLGALYFALSTLAAQAIVVDLAQSYQRAEVGEAGFITDRIFAGDGLYALQRNWAWLLTILLVAVVVGVTRIRRGRAGRAWRLLRDHELAAAAVGVNVARWRVAAMAMSSAAIGATGALSFFFTGVTTTAQFTLLVSIQFIAMLLIGGIDSVFGPVVGAAMVMLLPTITKEVIDSVFGAEFAAQNGARISQVVYGVLVLLVVVRARDGISGLITSASGRLAGRRRRNA